MSRSLPLALYLAQLRKTDRDGTQPPAYPPRSGEQLLWFNVDNEYECEAVLKLAERIRQARDWVGFLITVPDAVSIPKAALEGIKFCTVPNETRESIDRFLDHWRPDICVWAEGYLRPGLLAELKAREIPHFLINAQAAALDTRRWSWFPSLSKALLQGFTRVLAIDEAAALKLRKLGAPAWRIAVSGKLEEGSAALRYDENERASWVEDLAGRPVWLASNISKPEETQIFKAHRSARKFAHRILLILAPDKPDRGSELEKLAKKDGWVIARRSQSDPVTEATDIYIADKPGEMGLWFRLAPISFLGDSLHSEGGGSDPTEPAALGSAIIHGPHTGRYEHTYNVLKDAGGALQVLNSDALAKAVGSLLSPDRTARMAHAAWDVSTKTAAVTEQVQALLFDALDTAEGR